MTGAHRDGRAPRRRRDALVRGRHPTHTHTHPHARTPTHTLERPPTPTPAHGRTRPHPRASSLPPPPSTPPPSRRTCGRREGSGLLRRADVRDQERRPLLNITADGVTQLLERFHRLDASGDGRLGVDEFTSALGLEQASPQYVRRLFSFFDTDGLTDLARSSAGAPSPSPRPTPPLTLTRTRARRSRTSRSVGLPRSRPASPPTTIELTLTLTLTSTTLTSTLTSPRASPCSARRPADDKIKPLPALRPDSTGGVTLAELTRAL